MAFKVSDNVAHRIDKPVPPPKEPAEYEVEIYSNGVKFQRPPFTFQPAGWESEAEKRMGTEAKGYIFGNAGTGETYKKNIVSFRKWSLVPKRLIETPGLPVLKTSVLGKNFAYPIAVAPVGVQRLYHVEGEEASAAAAAAQGLPYIMSTASATSIEDVAKANGSGERWYQLYWPGNQHNDVTASILKRAKKAGFSALFVTVDTYMLGWRPYDMDNGYNPFLRSDKIGVAVGFSDPVFRAHFREKHGKEIEEDMQTAAYEWTTVAFAGVSHSWEDVKFLQENWDGPIIIKGIQTVEDAKMAVKYGVQGVVVSNHGGRQFDGSASSLAMLPKIADAVGDKIDVFFDSGIRCGADIAKALALGAKMCLIGRPFMWGLTIGGQPGVEHILKALLGDLQLTLHMCGIPSVDKKDLNPSVMIREDDY